MENIGEPVIFAWVETVRQYLADREENKAKFSSLEKSMTAEAQLAADMDRLALGEHSKEQQLVQHVECPEILTGDCIEDRKSVFQVGVLQLCQQKNWIYVVKRL